MKYAKPQIVSVYKAVDAIQSIHAAKPGVFSDGLEATSSAYEADE
jgi:hypothetical protein